MISRSKRGAHRTCRNTAMKQTTLHKLAETPQVTILVNEHVAYCNANDADRVAPLLQRQTNRFDTGGSRGVRRTVLTKNHYARNQEGLLFFSGLVPRVQRALKRQGYSVMVNDQTDCQWLDEARQAANDFGDLNQDEEQLLDAVCSRPHGQLVVQRTDDVARYLALLADVFADRALLVVAKNKDHAARLHHLVSEYALRRIALYPQQPWRMGIDPWAIIGSIPLINADLASWQAVIFADVESALAAPTMKQLEDTRNFLCYGFVPPNSPLSDYDLFRLEELVGPVIYRKPRSGPQPAEVDVVLLEAPPLPQLTFDGALARKRSLIWRNEDRNRRIAAVATGIQRGWAKKLVADGLLQHHQARAIFARGRHPRTAIVVENSEHGEQLHRLLPRWGLRTTHELASCIPVVTGQEIATMVYVDQYGVDVDILIRADGGPEWPLEPRVFPPVSVSPGRVVVVDFGEGSDERAQRAGKRQRRAYRDRGWHLIE